MREVRNYYSYGNVALSPEKIYDDPDYYYDQEREARRRREYELHRRRAQRIEQRTRKMSALTMCLCVVLISSALFVFVFLQNQIAACKKNIASLENQITTINTLNDATKSRIDSSLNLNDIKEKAMKMGMVYADGDHVVRYDANNSEFMQKY